MRRRLLGRSAQVAMAGALVVGPPPPSPEVEAPDLVLKVGGDAQLWPGKTGTIQLEVSNKPDAGPTGGAVTATYTFPSGLHPVRADGDGWNCGVVGDLVTCARPGIGTRGLQPDTTAPPVTIEFVAEPDTSGVLTGTGTATTPGAVPDPESTDIHAVNVNPPSGLGPTAPPAPTNPPDLVLKASGDTVVAPGKTGVVRLQVSDKQEAGPTSGTVSAVYKSPSAVEVESVEGDGWRCDTEDDVITCTRPGSGPDALQPGTTEPPITIRYVVAQDAGGSLTGTGLVTTPGTQADSDDLVEHTVTFAGERGTQAVTGFRDAPVRLRWPRTAP